MNAYRRAMAAFRIANLAAIVAYNRYKRIREWRRYSYFLRSLDLERYEANARVAHFRASSAVDAAERRLIKLSERGL